MTGLHRHGNQINKHIRADLLAHIVAVCVYVYVCICKWGGLDHPGPHYGKWFRWLVHFRNQNPESQAASGNWFGVCLWSIRAIKAAPSGPAAYLLLLWEMAGPIRNVCHFITERSNEPPVERSASARLGPHLFLCLSRKGRGEQSGGDFANPKGIRKCASRR